MSATKAINVAQFLQIETQTMDDDATVLCGNVRVFTKQQRCLQRAAAMMVEANNNRSDTRKPLAVVMVTFRFALPEKLHVFHIILFQHFISKDAAKHWNKASHSR